MYQSLYKSFSVVRFTHKQDEDEFDIDLRDFLQEKYPGTDLEKLRSKIDSVEIKNIIKRQTAVRFLDLF